MCQCVVLGGRLSRAHGGRQTARPAAAVQAVDPLPQALTPLAAWQAGKLLAVGDSGSGLHHPHSLHPLLVALLDLLVHELVNLFQVFYFYL